MSRLQIRDTILNIKRTNNKDFKIQHDNENYSKEKHISFATRDTVKISNTMIKDIDYSRPATTGLQLGFETVPYYATLKGRLPHKHIDDSGIETNYLSTSRPINISVKK